MFSVVHSGGADVRSWGRRGGRRRGSGTRPGTHGGIQRGFCKSAFVTSALRRVSVALFRGNGRVYRESLFTLARAGRRAFQTELLVPAAE
jgi:hypothetical protein